MHSLVRDKHGRFVPVVRPKLWQSASVKRSRERAERIAAARKQQKAWCATTQWLEELDRRGIAALEATGIEWSSVERWIDALEPREAFVARMVVRQALQLLADDEAPLRERFEARNELYRRMIAAGVVE
jgi:hypothetical protein